ncbi:MAG: protein kinase [Anaerolineae bacterium]|jgi:tRNA A-37 threonylcarbamoyl transferase component Bud32|nr:protein kinase [Anaerolineae bacterium]
MAADEAAEADPGATGGGRLGSDDPTQHAREDALTQPSRENSPTVPSRNEAKPKGHRDTDEVGRSHPDITPESVPFYLDDGKRLRWCCVKWLTQGATSGALIYRAEDRLELPGDVRYSYRDKFVVKYISLTSAYARQKIDSYAREVETIHQLDNPHIVRLWDALLLRAEDGEPYALAIVMDLIEGPTLEDSGTVWTLPMLREMVRQLATVLNELHNRGITHGDITPGNLMLKAPIDPIRPTHFHLYLLDFGLSQMNTGMLRTPQRDIDGTVQTLRLLAGGDAKLPKPVKQVLKNASEAGYDSFAEFAEAFLGVVDAVIAGQVQPADPTLVRPPHELIPTAVEEPEPAADDEAHPLEEPPAQQHYTRTRRATVGRIGRWSVGVMMAGALFFALALSQVQTTAAQGVGLSVSGGRVVLIDHKTGYPVHDYPRYPARVHTYSPDGRYLAAERVVLDRRTGMLVRRFDDAPHPVAVAFSPDAALLLIHDGAEVSVWDIKTGQRVRTLTGLTVEDLQRIFTPEGRALVQRQLMAALP